MASKTNAETVISVDCFDIICRICFCDVKEVKVVHLNDYLIENRETATENKGKLIRDILAKYTSIEVSTKFHIQCVL